MMYQLLVTPHSAVRTRAVSPGVHHVLQTTPLDPDVSMLSLSTRYTNEEKHRDATYK